MTFSINSPYDLLLACRFEHKPCLCFGTKGSHVITMNAAFSDSVRERQKATKKGKRANKGRKKKEKKKDRD